VNPLPYLAETGVRPSRRTSGENLDIFVGGGTRVDGTAVVVAIHHVPVVVPPFDLLMPEVKLTGVALSAHAFPSVIAAMAAGSYPLDGWVETIPFEDVVERGFERLRRQEGLKILVDVGS